MNERSLSFIFLLQMTSTSSYLLMHLLAALHTCFASIGVHSIIIAPHENVYDNVYVLMWSYYYCSKTCKISLFFYLFSSISLKTYNSEAIYDYFIVFKLSKSALIGSGKDTSSSNSGCFWRCSIPIRERSKLITIKSLVLQTLKTFDSSIIMLIHFIAGFLYPSLCSVYFWLLSFKLIICTSKFKLCVCWSNSCWSILVTPSL